MDNQWRNFLISVLAVIVAFFVGIVSGFLYTAKNLAPGWSDTYFAGKFMDSVYQKTNELSRESFHYSHTIYTTVYGPAIEINAGETEIIINIREEIAFKVLGIPENGVYGEEKWGNVESLTEETAKKILNAQPD
jgi:hypothetical protein